MNTRRLLAASTVVFFAISVGSMTTAAASSSKHSSSGKSDKMEMASKSHDSEKSKDEGKSRDEGKSKSDHKDKSKHEDKKMDKDKDKDKDKKMDKDKDKHETTTTMMATTTTAPAVKAATVCVDLTAGKVVLPIETHFEGKAGSTKVLLSKGVIASAQGATATAVFTGKNNGSVRSGSKLIVKSGKSSVTLDDVEASAGKVTTGTGTLTLGKKVDIAVVVGPMGAFSGGGELELTINCAPAPTVAPTTAAPVTTVVEATTTTTAPVEVLDKTETPEVLAKTGSDLTMPLSIAALTSLLGGLSLLKLARTARREESVA